MAAKKRLVEALQALQKHPKVQALKESVEKQFSQPVIVKLVMPKTAPFGCQFRFDETDIGKLVNPIIEISNTLEDQLTDEQRQLRDSHNAVYAADWERLRELSSRTNKKYFF